MSMRFLLELAWRDLRASGRSLWIFVACLVLGVSLVAAGGGLYLQVADALRNDARLLFGGDVEVEHTQPLPADALAWMQQGATVSRLVELRTMLRTADGRSQLIELQSADSAYPLYGAVTLSPAGTLTDALRGPDWGAAIDGALAQRLGLAPGDRIHIGDLNLEVRALITRQPDRSLRADWGGAPVLVADGALRATGLVQPLSRVEYHYRVRTDEPPALWRDRFMAAFPALDAEVNTFDERSARMAEVLGQIGSGLLLIGFSALFIGGLGVFNSVQAYLQGKLGTLATLRALGLRDRRLAALVLLQVLMLALLASGVGVLVGNALALAGTWAAAQRLPLAPLLQALWLPSLVALGFGVLTALAFALPALGRVDIHPLDLAVGQLNLPAFVIQREHVVCFEARGVAQGCEQGPRLAVNLTGDGSNFPRQRQAGILLACLRRDLHEQLHIAWAVGLHHFAFEPCPGRNQPMAASLVLLDLALSGVGDTVVLPYTIYRQVIDGSIGIYWRTTPR